MCTTNCSWHLCDWCGAMRCDPAPVMRKTQAVQSCVCEYPDGERGWRAAQEDAAARAPRQWTLREYTAAVATSH
jgi:hypothetical protein